MNISNLYPEPEFPKRPQLATEIIRQQMERQMAPFREFERIQQEAQRALAPLREFEKIQALLGQSSQFSIVDAVAKHSATTYSGLKDGRWAKRYLDEFELISPAVAHAQRMLSQYLPEPYLFASQQALLKQHGQASVLASLSVAGLTAELSKSLEHRDWLDKIKRHTLGAISVQEITASSVFGTPAMTALQQAQRMMASLSATFSTEDLNAFHFGEDEESEAEAAAESITRGAASEPSLQAAVEQMVRAIQAQADPSVRLMLWIFCKRLLDWIIAGIIGAVISQHMPQTAAQSPQEATKAVREIARSAVDSKVMLNDFRFVSASMLVVRQTPRARAPAVGTLRFGSVVQVSRREKDFAFVAWTDQASGAQIHGWVFARYLQKFK